GARVPPPATTILCSTGQPLVVLRVGRPRYVLHCSTAGPAFKAQGIGLEQVHEDQGHRGQGDAGHRGEENRKSQGRAPCYQLRSTQCAPAVDAENHSRRKESTPQGPCILATLPVPSAASRCLVAYLQGSNW